MKKAKLMSSHGVKRSEVVDDTEDFTERVLMSLVVDISLLNESVERIRVQVMTLAKERGIEPPGD